MGNTIQKLKRGRTSRHLGLEAPLAPEGDGLTPAFPQAQARYFSASGKKGEEKPLKFTGGLQGTLISGVELALTGTLCEESEGPREKEQEGL